MEPLGASAEKVVIGQYVLESRVLKRRSLGSDLEHRVIEPGGTEIFRGESTGRSVRRPAAFRGSNDQQAWTLEGAGKLSPSTWLLRDADGDQLARFVSSSARRGATRVELCSGVELAFDPATTMTKDFAKAAVLLDGDRFVLRAGDAVVADTARNTAPRERAGLVAQLVALPGALAKAVATRGDFHRSGSLTVVGDFDGASPALIGALLLFHDQVVHPMRSP